MLHPFTIIDLRNLSLGDRIRDFHEITHLYPEKLKHEAFKEFVSYVGGNY